jgi:FdhE protein
MSAPDAVLNGLRRERPEWEPWLAVVDEILREAGGPAWEAAVPSAAQALSSQAQGTAVPLLAGTTLTLDAALVRRLFERLIRTASRAGTPKMSSLKAALHADLEWAPLFTASLCQDSDRDGGQISEIAAVSGADAEALHAVIALLPVPFLHACNRRWASSISASWVEGYCPVCGSWPAFAEVRGIERNRYFRCGRCGGEWHARALYCPYCAMSDHDELVALVPEHGGSNAVGSNAVIDACQRCLEYVKTFTRLQGCSPGAVMLEDLASVDLDVAAIEHGFARSAGPGFALGITVTGAVTDSGARRGFFARK